MLHLIFFAWERPRLSRQQPAAESLNPWITSASLMTILFSFPASAHKLVPFKLVFEVSS